MGQGAAFTSDGTYLAISHYSSPCVTIYKRSGDTFTKLANPAALPTSIGTGAAFTSDGVYLAVSHYTSPFVTIYKRSGDTFTKLANPDILPTAHGRGATFTSDGTYLAIAQWDTPSAMIYKRDGNTFIKVTNPTTLPGSAYGATFVSDGTYLAISHDALPRVTIYKRDEELITDFSGTPLSGDTIPFAVTFTDSSTGTPTSWLWNFGDGVTSTTQNPVHNYTAAGSYTVSLTATNSAGSDTKTKPSYIKVSRPMIDAVPGDAIVLTTASGDASDAVVSLTTTLWEVQPYGVGIPKW